MGLESMLSVGGFPPPKHMQSKSVTQQKSKPIQLDAFVKSAV